MLNTHGKGSTNGSSTRSHCRVGRETGRGSTELEAGERREGIVASGKQAFSNTRVPVQVTGTTEEGKRLTIMMWAKCFALSPSGHLKMCSLQEEIKNILCIGRHENSLKRISGRYGDCIFRMQNQVTWSGQITPPINLFIKKFYKTPYPSPSLPKTIQS